MKELRTSLMAAWLSVAACADVAGHEGPQGSTHCPASELGTTTAPLVDRGRPWRPSIHSPASSTMSPAQPPDARDPSSDSGCGDPHDAEPHERLWDGTGRAEAVRGA